MQTRRFFANKITGSTAVISGSDYKHIVSVLRLKKGDTINVFNYEHGEFEASISLINSREKRVSLSVGRLVRPVEKNSVSITAAVSVIKNENMDLVIEKLTELGVDRIIPVVTRRCVVKEREPGKKAARWEKIIYSAVKQSGRLTSPVLSRVLKSAAELAASEKEGARFLAWEKEQEKFLIDEAVKLGPEKNALIFTGPEGGFEDSEAALLIESGFIPVSLGPATLRAETAVITAAGVISQALRRVKWKAL